MRKKLDEKEWKITIIDRSTVNHYQPGWLFVPFGVYDIKECIRPLSGFIPKGVDFGQRRDHQHRPRGQGGHHHQRQARVRLDRGLHRLQHHA